MTNLRTIRLVAGREIRERFQSRTLWIITTISAIAVVVLVLLPGWLKNTTSTTTVGLVGTYQDLGSSLESRAEALGISVAVVDLTGAHAAVEALDAGTIDVAVAPATQGANVLVEKEVSSSVQSAIQAVLNDAHMRDTLATAGIPLSSVTDALTPVPVSVPALPPASEIAPARGPAAFASGLLLYMSILMYGSFIAQGVAQEKTSRTAEVLLSAVAPRNLLVGKVVGIGTAALTQMAITVVAGLGANVASGGTNISHVVWSLLPQVMGWFLLGFALYAMAFAAAGALVSRQEDVQIAIMPLVLPLIASFLLLYVLLFDPSNPWVEVLSLVPFFTPVLMPARAAFSDVPAWEVGMGVALTLAAIWLVVRVSSRIYATAFLQTGARQKWGAVLRGR